MDAQMERLPSSLSPVGSAYLNPCNLRGGLDPKRANMRRAHGAQRAWRGAQQRRAQHARPWRLEVLVLLKALLHERASGRTANPTPLGERADPRVHEHTAQLGRLAAA